MTIKEIALIFIGGGSGSLVRYILSKLIVPAYGAHFPLATLVVNILAGLVLGIFLGVISSKPVYSPDLQLFIAVGFCGGFSTFSTFSYETLQLLRTGQVVLALLNIFLSVLLCLGATWLGLLFGKNV